MSRWARSVSVFPGSLVAGLTSSNWHPEESVSQERRQEVWKKGEGVLEKDVVVRDAPCRTVQTPSEWNDLSVRISLEISISCSIGDVVVTGSCGTSS